MSSPLALDMHAKRAREYLQNAERSDAEAGDNRIKAGRELTAAQRLVNAGESNLTWTAWCTIHIQRSARDIRRLMALASADDPAQARENEKARNRQAKPAGSRAASPFQALDEGVGAFLRGVSQDDCPYTDRKRHAAWRKGWSEMERRTGASPVVTPAGGTEAVASANAVTVVDQVEQPGATSTELPSGMWCCSSTVAEKAALARQAVKDQPQRITRVSYAYGKIEVLISVETQPNDVPPPFAANRVRADTA